MLKVQSPRELGDEIRRLVKSVYGDEFDSAYFYTGRRAVLLGDPSELAALLAPPLPP